MTAGSLSPGRLFAALVLASAGAWSGVPGQSDGSAIIDLTVRPTSRLTSQIESIAVRTEVSGTLPRAAQRFSVRAPIVYAGLGEIADRVDSLVMRDASGVVPVSVIDEPAQVVDAIFKYYETRGFEPSAAEREVQLNL